MNAQDLTVPGLLLTAVTTEAAVIVYLFRELQKVNRARVANAERYLLVLKHLREKSLNDSEPPPSNSDGRMSLR